jgi:hypothetical protein
MNARLIEGLNIPDRWISMDLDGWMDEWMAGWMYVYMYE